MIGHIVYEFWSVALVFGLFSHDVWFTMAISYVITNGMLWASDHSIDPLDIGILFHIWYLIATFAGALVGLLMASALGLPKLFFTNQLHRGRWTERTVCVFLFLVFGLAAAAAINIVLCRLCVGGGGMNPIGLSENFSHIFGGILLGVSVFIILVVIGKLGRIKDPRGIVTVKYILITLVFPNILTLVYDLLFFDAGLMNVVPGLVYLVALWFGLLLLWLLSIYVPTIDGAERYDDYYKNNKLAGRMVLSLGVIMTLGALSVFITLWVTDFSNNEGGVIAMFSYSLLAIVVLIIYDMNNGRSGVKSNAQYGVVMHGMSVADQIEINKRI